MPSVIPGTTPGDSGYDGEIDLQFEGTVPNQKPSKFPSMKYPSINKNPAKRPFWYNPDYWQEGTLSKRRQVAEATFGPWRRDDDPNPLYNNAAIRYKAVSNNLDPYAYADFLSRRYPGMSPSMLAALVANGTPPTADVVSADGIAFGGALDSKRAVKPSTALGQGLTGLKYDYSTKGTVTIDGQEIEVGEGQAVIRDSNNTPVHVFTVGQDKSAKSGDSFAPYDWLKGLSRNFFGLLNMPVSGIQATFRNVAKDLKDGNVGEAALSALEFIPAVSVITELNNPENINPWEQTDFGQSILAAVGQYDDKGTWVPGSWAGGEGVDQGDGFFIGLDSEVGTAARDAAISAYEINGEAWTYGRGLAAAIDMDPDSIAYNVLSGTVDLGMAIVTDPTIWTAGLGLPSHISKSLTGGKALFGIAKRQAIQQERQFVASLHGLSKIEDEVVRLTDEVANATSVEDAAKFNEDLARKHEELLTVKAEIDDMGLTPEQVTEARQYVRDLEGQRSDLMEREYDAGQAYKEATRAEHEAQLLANATSDPAYTDTLAQYQETVSRLQQIEHRVDTAVDLGPDAYPVPDLSASLTTMVDNVGLDEIDQTVRRLSAQGGSMYGLRTRMPPPGALKRDAPLEPAPGMFDQSQQVISYWRPRDGVYRPPNLVDTADEVQPELVDALSARLADPVRGPGRPTRPLADIRAESAADPAAWRPRRVENGVYETDAGARIVRDADGDWTVYRPGAAEPEDVYRTLNEAKEGLAGLRAQADEGAYLQAREAATPTTLSLNTLRARLRKMGVLDTAYGQGVLRSAEDQLSRVDDLLTTPGLTHRQLVDEFDRMGLLPHLDIELKNLGVDGIKGVGRREGDNGFIWWGDNPDIDIYGARLSRMALDTEIRLTPAMMDEAGNVVGDIGLILDEAGQLAAAAKATQAQLDSIAAKIAAVEDSAAKGTLLLPEAQARVAALNAERAAINQQTQEVLAQQAASRVSGPEAMLTRRQELLAARERLAKDVGRYEDGGVMRAKNLDRLAQANAARLERLDAATATRDAIKSRLGGKEGAFGQRAIDYDLLRKGVFGGVGQRGAETAQGAIRYLAQMDASDAGRVMLLTKNKYPPEIIRDLVDNAAMTVDQARVNGVEAMFSAEKGTFGGAKYLDDDAAEAALRAYKEQRVVEILSNPMGVEMKVGSRAAQNLAAEAGDMPRSWSVRGTKIGGGTQAVVDRASRIIPGSLRVSLADGQDLAQKLDYYAVQVGKDEEYRAALFQKIYELDGQPGMEGGARTIIVDLMKDLIDTGAQRVMDTPWGSRNPEAAEVIREKLAKSLQVWNKEVGDARAYYQHGQSDGVLDIPHIIDANGEVIPMTNAHIEQEFANGNIFLPDPREVYRMTANVSRWLESGKIRGGVFESFDKAFSDYWRSLVLVRPAYIVRNIAEMEIRNFLAGEVNLFTNPFAVAGMVFGNKDGGFLARTMSRGDKYANDIRGDAFLKRAPDDTDDEALAYRQIHDRYLEVIDIGGGSISDPRLYDIAATRGGMKSVSAGEPQFNEGWARELMRLDRDTASRLVLRGRPDGRQDEVVELLVASGKDEMTAHQDAVLDWVFGTDEGLAWRERLARGGGESFQRIAEDQAAMRQYLFTWDKSVQNRIRDFTGDDERLLSFLRSGELKDEAGEVVTRWPRSKDANADAQNLKRLLTDEFKDVSIGQNTKVWVTPEGRRANRFEQGTSWFFRQSAKMERLGAMGPEYRQAYWTKVHELSGVLSAEAKRSAGVHAQDSLMTLTQAGKPWGHSRRIYKDITDESKSGPMTLDEAHAIASDHAGDVVADLYYDATQRRAFFQATRMAMPFGQAWANSFAKWTELAAKNPVQVYRAQRAMYAALEKDSSTIYDMMETNPWDWDEKRNYASTNWYDPSQGFVQFDDFGEPMVYMPGIGTALSGLSSLLNGGESTPAQMSGFRLKGLNLLTAGSDSPMPPIGPAATIPASWVMDRLNTNEFLYDYLFPYGEPTASDGIMESMLPAWARRLLGSMDSPDNQYRLQNLKPAMAHLAQAGDYDLTSEAEKQRFLDDATDMTRWMTAVTAIGQAILPTTPASKYQFDDPRETGERLALTAVANLFYDQYEPQFGNYEEAWEAFFNDFGVQGVIAITSTSDTPVGTSIKDEAWEKMRKFPDLALAYPEEMAALYPGGDVSTAARSWQAERALRKGKPPAEVLDDVYSRLYRIQKSRIDRQASELGWPDERKAQEVERLDRSYQATGKPAFGGTIDPSARIGKIESFILANPEIASDPTPNQFILAIEKRDDILAEMEGRGFTSKTMSAKKAAPYQRAYFALLDGLTAQNKDFSEVARLLKKEQS